MRVGVPDRKGSKRPARATRPVRAGLRLGLMNRSRFQSRRPAGTGPRRSSRAIAPTTFSVFERSALAADGKGHPGTCPARPVRRSDGWSSSRPGSKNRGAISIAQAFARSFSRHRLKSHFGGGPRRREPRRHVVLPPRCAGGRSASGIGYRTIVKQLTTLSGGSLGSCVDEERSQLRELM